MKHLILLQLIPCLFTLKSVQGFYKEFVDYHGIPADYTLDKFLPKLSHSDILPESQRLKRETDSHTFEDMKRAPVTTSPEYLKQIVDEHNHLRSLHNVPPLTLDDELSATAQFWANYLGRASEGLTLPVLFRKAWYEIGRNIWAAVGRKDANYISPTFAWYNEERFYTYGNDSYCGANPRMAKNHVDYFTQMIWKQTTKLGCAKFKNKSKHIYVVCHYQPPGNVRGQYLQNVPKPSRIA